MAAKLVLCCRGGITAFINESGTSLCTKDLKNRTSALPITSIQSVSLTEPKGRFVPGRIEISTSEANEGGLYLGLGIGIAAGSKRIFDFDREEFEHAQELINYIQDYRPSAPAATTADGKAVVSVVEEIRGLKSLLDDGILTNEEFEAKKKQLLGI